MVPDFILGGVMKSGTTFLHNLLQNHPQVKIIDRNMDHAYFDDDRIFERGKEWYLSLFDGAMADKKAGKLIGQTSADCNFNPGSVKRIMEHNPDTKLIFILRHPIDRAYSLYWHQYGMGREFRKFEQAIAKEPELIKKSYHHLKHYSYMERSRYNAQFKEITELVPAENLLILDFESLVKNTKPTVNVVLEFLGLNKINNVEELNFSELPRNPAKIPTNHTVVLFSAFLQKIGLVPVGRRIVNLFREQVRPPKMKDDTRKMLEEELKEDIIFFEKVKEDFKSKTANQ
ncbi:sulfotransferase family protein [Flavobacterium litorale]|uniref:Sulfotransferase n=1 Tax=Flavobacterium litorale TaxID=2856519 RepID=A0ABX8V8D7_9FLAO|nr:sulfotransferase [Flavobacterium litorale]QYJ67296.1 sulfotransferase [Flavobacterium litorale]